MIPITVIEDSTSFSLHQVLYFFYESVLQFFVLDAKDFNKFCCVIYLDVAFPGTKVLNLPHDQATNVLVDISTLQTEESTYSHLLPSYRYQAYLKCKSNDHFR